LADKVKISISEANAAVRAIKSKANEAQNTVNRLQRDIGNVMSWWEGDSAVAFVNEFEKSKKDFDKMIECINRYGDLLTRAIKIQQDADAEIARKMHG